MSKVKLRAALALGALAMACAPANAAAPVPAAIARMHHLLDERPMLGRTPSDWLAWTRGSFAGTAGFASARPGGLAIARAGAAAVANLLVDDVAHIDALAGAPVDRAEIARRVAAIPPAVRAPFGALVRTVAGAYGAQLAVAREVRSRMRAGFDESSLMTISERDASAARAAAIVRALDSFRDATRGVPVPARIAADPPGLVVLGGDGDDSYASAPGAFRDPVLLVDPAGSDTYETSAGAACVAWPTPTPDTSRCNGLALSILADLGESASNDTYRYDGAMTVVQGSAGPGALGILLDDAGNDRYLGKMTAGKSQRAIGSAWLGGGQGYGLGGVGVLVDRAGADSYRFDVASLAGQSTANTSQGYGQAGGLGIALDLKGNDYWTSNAYGAPHGAFAAVYTMGTGEYGGVGIMDDLGGGNDTYRSEAIADGVDYYAQGFGAFGGLGILADDDGDDDYYTYERALARAGTILNCAYGTGSFAGAGVMIDGGGDDVYYGGTFSAGDVVTMDNGWGAPGAAYGLFVDASGDDSYVMEGEGSSVLLVGRGYYEPTETSLAVGTGEDNLTGTFADLGGRDRYVGGEGADDQVWPLLGIDENS
jgi:hypothetical protein